MLICGTRPPEGDEPTAVRALSKTRREDVFFAGENEEFVVVSMIDEVGLLESECVRNGRLRSGTTGLAAHLYE